MSNCNSMSKLSICIIVICIYWWNNLRVSNFGLSRAILSELSFELGLAIWVQAAPLYLGYIQFSFIHFTVSLGTLRVKSFKGILVLFIWFHGYLTTKSCWLIAITMTYIAYLFLWNSISNHTLELSWFFFVISINYKLLSLSLGISFAPTFLSIIKHTFLPLFSSLV